MESQIIDQILKQNLRPLSVPHKTQYYEAIRNIEYSFTGRMDDKVSINTFILEATQLLANAITLFEQGYFDCSYYSLRSAIEVSSLVVYFIDIPENERSKNISDWSQTKDFPTQGRVLGELAKGGDIYCDMKEKMPSFFLEAKDIVQKINKYVHKQGFRHFYVSRNHPINHNKPQDVFISNFEYYLKKTISIVSIMRLAIDPFPVLLSDEAIMYRYPDSLTDPYSDDFISEYIGNKLLKDYKNTEIYKGYYSFFIQEEKRNAAVFDVEKNQFIDRHKQEEILSQFHLLHIDDKICATIAFACNKATQVYAYDGLKLYFTELKTNRKAHSWFAQDFKTFSENNEKANQAYDEVYITAFKVNEEYYFAEHNELLTTEEVETVNLALAKLEGALL